VILECQIENESLDDGSGSGGGSCYRHRRERGIESGGVGLLDVV
jgi:hypothetical protein